jgi:hypothetical protein
MKRRAVWLSGLILVSTLSVGLTPVISSTPAAATVTVTFPTHYQASFDGCSDAFSTQMCADVTFSGKYTNCYFDITSSPPAHCFFKMTEIKGTLTGPCPLQITTVQPGMSFKVDLLSNGRASVPHGLNLIANLSGCPAGVSGSRPIGTLGDYRWTMFGSSNWWITDDFADPHPLLGKVQIQWLGQQTLSVG